VSASNGAFHHPCRWILATMSSRRAAEQPCTVAVRPSPQVLAIARTTGVWQGGRRSTTGAGGTVRPRFLRDEGVSRVHPSVLETPGMR